MVECAGASRGHRRRADQPGTLEELVADWRAYLDDTPPSWQADRIRQHVRTGRPLGDEKLLAAAEKATGRALRRKQAGGESARPSAGKG